VLGVDLNYEAPGATRVADEEWHPRPKGYRAYERTVAVGTSADWDELADAVLRWEVKLRSGFVVRSVRRFEGRVSERENYTLRPRLGPLHIREPVHIVAVVDTPDRCGFAYGTQNGHPVSGEEAFVVHRDGEGTVWFTHRSLTAATRDAWLLAYPFALVAQQVYRRRYLRALRG